MVYPHTYRTEKSETRTTNASYGEYYATLRSRKIQIQPELLKILQYVDSKRPKFLGKLKEVVEIRSVSGEMAYREEVIKMIKYTEKWLKKLGIKYECFNIGYQVLDGKEVRLPPIILGSLGRNYRKKTVCVYAHIDVKKPRVKNWNTDPWTATEMDKNVYGCGVADGKGPLLCWFHCIQAFQQTGTELPVNVKFIIESMKANDSEGLESFLSLRKQDFLYDVDYVVVNDSEWIGDKHPCISYGSVGLLHFKVTVEKLPESTSDPKDDMVKIFEKICDDQENILIPKFNDYVQQITPDEEMIYEAIQEFDPEDIRDTLPQYKRRWDKVKLLMNFWRLPSIYVDDIQECNCEKKDTNIVKRHFIIKIVPRQIVDVSVSATLRHIQHICKELKLENKVDCENLSASRPWVEDTRSVNYEAARRATIQIYKENPSMIREDRDMKVVNILSTVSEKNILLLPVGKRGINIGEDNENIPLRNFYEGTKLLGAYMFQIAALHE